MLAYSLSGLEIVAVVAYLLAIGYLGLLGYRRTRNPSDYLVGGKKTHPFIMALSYGATFISTSAIVGFGGVAGMFGMSLLWLTFLNIAVGIFVAFVLLGGRTRHMGHRLDAHTFPELLGRRFQSKFIQVFGGLVIFVFVPLYAAAVLIAGCEFITLKFGISYNVAVLVFSVIIAAYVVMGGLKGVMYTDALQGSLMFIGMLILLVWTYIKVGGVWQGHQDLAAVGSPLFNNIGFTGFTSMPKFGWGQKTGELWWTVVSSLTLGVGIGVLAQPQLAVRFMAVKSKRELNRAVLIGGLFILVMTGVAFTVGALSNVYFQKSEVITGKVEGVTDNAGVIVKQERGAEPVRLQCKLLHIKTNDSGLVTVVANGYDTVKDGKVVLSGSKILPHANVTDLGDGQVRVEPRSNSFFRAVTKRDDGDWMFNTDSIIPTFITSATEPWFQIVFLLTLLAAAMSTLSSQFHALGTAIGRDVYEQLSGRHGQGITVTRIGIIIGIILAVIFSFSARGGYIVARATTIFFGLCAASFLPTFIGALFCRWVTRAAAKASIFTGFAATALWLCFVQDKEARSLGICWALFKKHSLLITPQGPIGSWYAVDSILVALPLSALVLVVVSAFTRRPDARHLDRCFSAGGVEATNQPVKEGV
jgi:SSS family solute:Na+ symporter